MGNCRCIFSAKGLLELTSPRAIEPHVFNSVHMLKSTMRVSIKLSTLILVSSHGGPLGFAGEALLGPRLLDSAVGRNND